MSEVQSILCTPKPFNNATVFCQNLGHECPRYGNRSIGLREKPALRFGHGWLGGGKGGDEFVEDGGAVGFFGSQRPVGIMGIDHAEMTRGEQNGDRVCRDKPVWDRE